MAKPFFLSCLQGNIGDNDTDDSIHCIQLFLIYPNTLISSIVKYITAHENTTNHPGRPPYSTLSISIISRLLTMIMNL